MNKREVEQELNRISKQADFLLEKAEIEMNTVRFLEKQADILILKANDVSIPFDEKENLDKEIDSLRTRIKLEMKMINDAMPEIEKLDEKVQILSREIFTD